MIPYQAELNQFSLLMRLFTFAIFKIIVAGFFSRAFKDKSPGVVSIHRNSTNIILLWSNFEQRAVFMKKVVGGCPLIMAAFLKMKLLESRRFQTEYES